MAAVAAAHLVGAGGALGALARYGVTRALARDGVPAGTLAVNVLGSFLLGLLTFAGAGSDAMLFVGVGACGSFTTFSSFSFETVRLWEDGYRWRAAGHAVGTLAAALLAVGAAWGVVHLVVAA